MFGYHPMTVGFYVAELVRRTDPLHRSLSQFFHDELASKYALDFHFTCTDKMLEQRVAKLYNGAVTGAAMMTVQQNDWAARAFSSVEQWSPWKYRTVECPAVTGFSNARSLARLFVVLSGGGGGGGTTDQPSFISAQTFKRMCSVAIRGRDRIMDADVALTVGGLFHEGHHKIGHGGMGGSLCFVDVPRQATFAYVTNTLITGNQSEVDPRRQALHNALDSCLTNVHQTAKL
jgi:CubicO group peptidase (beta-lactamase class C family)